MRPNELNPMDSARVNRWLTAHGRAARVDCPKTDRYGRAVCRVMIDGADVGLEQIRRGYAWHYVKYAHEQRTIDRITYAQAESAARSTNSGLWSFADPLPPWTTAACRRASRRGALAERLAP